MDCSQHPTHTDHLTPSVCLRNPASSWLSWWFLLCFSYVLFKFFVVAMLDVLCRCGSQQGSNPSLGSENSSPNHWTTGEFLCYYLCMHGFVLFVYLIAKSHSSRRLMNKLGDQAVWNSIYLVFGFSKLYALKQIGMKFFCFTWTRPIEEIPNMLCPGSTAEDFGHKNVFLLVHLFICWSLFQSPI